MELVTGGDAGKVDKFIKENIDSLDEQIRIRTSEMATIDARIEDADEYFTECGLSIDITKIKTHETRAKYIVEYNKALSSTLNKREELEAEKVVKQKEIDRFNKIKNLFKTMYNKDE